MIGQKDTEGIFALHHYVQPGLYRVLIYILLIKRRIDTRIVVKIIQNVTMHSQKGNMLWSGGLWFGWRRRMCHRKLTRIHRKRIEHQALTGGTTQRRHEFFWIGTGNAI